MSSYSAELQKSDSEFVTVWCGSFKQGSEWEWGARIISPHCFESALTRQKCGEESPGQVFVRSPFLGQEAETQEVRNDFSSWRNSSSTRTRSLYATETADYVTATLKVAEGQLGCDWRIVLEKEEEERKTKKEPNRNRR